MVALKDRNILVVDDSQAVGLFLKEFLRKLGFNNIHYCENGETAIKAFMGLVTSGATPIVFLDYNLPDMNAYSVMTQLLNVKPDVKVIIATARDRSEDSIKEVIARGAYQYLSKPIRLESVRDIMKTLEQEEYYTESVDEDLLEKTLNLINTSTQITLLRLSQYLDKTKEELAPIVEKLVSTNQIMNISKIKEIACPDCGMVKVTHTFNCPACHGANFKQEKLIEHYECGNVSPTKTYDNDVCPKCRKPIKVLGVDYRVMENFYICNDCNDKFAEIESNFLCLKCNKRFPIEQAKWETSEGYKIRN